MVAFAGFVVRQFVKDKTPQELRVLEKAYQSAVRRELRGLPAEHDQSLFNSEQTELDVKHQMRES